MKLVITRPEPDAERTAAALSACGHAVLLMPLLRIELIADAKLGSGPFGAVLVTSANACRAIAAHQRVSELLSLPVFAVGRRTGEAAREAGFTDVMSADGAVHDLARLVARRLGAGGPPLLYLAGEDRAGDLDRLLGTHDFAVRIAVVYRAVAETQLTQLVRNAFVAGEIDGVLHFSRRSAEAFILAAQASDNLPASLNASHYCLSAQVAAPLKAAGAAQIHIAPEPQERALLDLLPRV
jgi:uroporphyrinogen-III synthase